jgi:hypothetical protein
MGESSDCRDRHSCEKGQSSTKLGPSPGLCERDWGRRSGQPGRLSARATTQQAPRTFVPNPLATGQCSRHNAPKGPRRRAPAPRG